MTRAVREGTKDRYTRADVLRIGIQAGIIVGLLNYCPEHRMPYDLLSWKFVSSLGYAIILATAATFVITRFVKPRPKRARR